MYKIHLAFITSNAGDDIPGSTIKWTIKNYGSFFDSVKVVDGRLTSTAIEFYNDNKIEFVNSPWKNKHLDQYKVRDSLIPEGDWVFALDCDESPSPPLVNNIRDIIKKAEESRITQIGLPAMNMWCKHNSDLFYPVDKPENVINPSKWVLYKVNKSIQYVCNKTGSHVTPITGPNRGAIRIPYFHFKSPETTAFNAAICLMDDLRPINEDPCAPIRGISKEELDKLERIGNKYNLLNGALFRRITKAGMWPKELEDLVRTFKNPGRGLFSRSMYTTYFTFLNHGVDDNRLSYDEACEIADFNENYKLRERYSTPIKVFHTDVILMDPNTPCGAG